MALRLSRRRAYAFAFLAVSLILAACSSGNKTLPYSPTGTPTPFVPTPTPTPTATPQNAPKSILVTAVTPCLLGTVQNGYTMPDLVPQSLAAIPVDSNGNLEIGPSAPTVTVTSASPSNLSVAPGTNSPNSFTLTGNPLAFTNNPIGLTITATQTVGGSASVTVNANVTVQQTLLAIGSSALNAYAITTGTLCWSLPVSNSGGTVDASGNMYVATGANVSMYTPGSSKAVLTGPVSGTITSIATDNNANVYIGSPGLVYKYTLGAQLPTLTIVPPFQSAVTQLVLDPNSNLYVSNGFPTTGNSIAVYAPNATVPTYTILGNLQVMGLLTDSASNLYELDGNSWRVNVYPAGSTVPTLMTNALSNQPYALALDKTKKLYVGAANSMYVYAPGGVAPTAIFGTNFILQKGIAVDQNGLMYVLDASGTISVYPASGSGTVLYQVGGTGLQGGSLWIRP
ncbi:MAG: hypothetical protein JO359_00590 [Candidatus Eremiobacteraeota bacterium]|nr:hypothetical protein [Candidatus Eremiobacteraeota bacterium]